ncbi:uncharacterized protein LOC133919015 [Phragmites australis]|uniref:uncharacterized protein LOC133919015 n=1 Tax=Phragmites australis TaxID=29695 RepID=UPI002D7830D2|nr:uncharacterized protein LOC133919015 [Phragmites australis]
MGEKAADAAAAAAGTGDQDDGQAAAAAGLDGIQYCSEHPYRPGTAAALVAGGGICAFCLQEKLGRLVSSSKSSPFFPLGGHPPPSGSPSSPPSFRRAAEPPPPLHPSGASRKFIPFHRKKTPSSSSSSSSSASAALSEGGVLKRSKSVAPRPEEQFPYSSASSVTAESPRKKSFWSFLYLSSSSFAYAHQTTASTPYTNGGGAAARRKSVSVASAAWASRGGAAAGVGAHDQQLRAGTSSTLGRTLEAIGEPESPSQVSSSSSFGRKVARSRSVGCGSRSFSGDFLERLSNGFGDCTLRRVESHRESKPHKMRGALGHLGGAADDEDGDDDDVYEHQHRIKCAGFFGSLGPASSTYWLSAASGGVGSGTRRSGGRSHRSWAWALASPMRALRPTTSSTSTKTITVVPPSHVTVHGNGNGNTSTSSLSISSPTPSSSEATAAAVAN